MERKRAKNAVVMWVVLVGFVSQNVVIPVMCRSLEGAGVQHWNTPKSHPKSPQCKTPTGTGGGGHGRGKGGGSGGGGSGGGSYNPSPPTPPRPTVDPDAPSPTPTVDPDAPSPTPTVDPDAPSPPRPTVDPDAPSPTPTVDPYAPSPPRPTVDPDAPSPTPTVDPDAPSPPRSTVDPDAPSPPKDSFFNPVPPTISPSTPTFEPAPTVPYPYTQPSYPGTCIFWGKHPVLIWGLFGYWGTMGGIFGKACTFAFGKNLSLQQALLNTRNDGIGSLYREGTASLLNSMVTSNFPYTTQEVKDHFMAALVSDKAAADQAQLFKKANEGQLKL